MGDTPLDELRREWERARAHPIEHYGEADHPERGTIACVTLHDAEQIVAALTTALAAKDEQLRLCAESAQQGYDALEAENCDLMEKHDAEFVRAEQAEAEAERLRCCGNCGHRDEETLDYSGSYFVCLTELSIEVDCEDQCRFTPSRWQRREG